MKHFASPLLISSQNSPTARRKTIIAYLAGLSGRDEVGLLVDQVTLGFPEEGLAGLSLAKMTGFIRLCEHIYSSMPSGVVPHIDRLISLTLRILRHALEEIPANRQHILHSGQSDVVPAVSFTPHTEDESTGSEPHAVTRKRKTATCFSPGSRGKRRKGEPGLPSVPNGACVPICETATEPEATRREPLRKEASTVILWTNLRNHCIRRIGEAVAGIDEVDWGKYLPEFLDLISPMIPRLPADCRTSPSAVMDALLSIASQQPTVSLLAERGVLEHMFSCLSVPNGLPSLILPLLDVIDGLVSMAQDTPPIDLLTPIASHLLSHLLPMTKGELRFASFSHLLFGTVWVLTPSPHFVAIQGCRPAWS